MWMFGPFWWHVGEETDQELSIVFLAPYVGKSLCDNGTFPKKWDFAKFGIWWVLVMGADSRGSGDASPSKKIKGDCYFRVEYYEIYQVVYTYATFGRVNTYFLAKKGIW